MGKGGGGRERRGRKIGKKGRRLMMLMGEIKGGEWRKWNGFREVLYFQGGASAIRKHFSILKTKRTTHPEKKNKWATFTKLTLG